MKNCQSRCLRNRHPLLCIPSDLILRHESKAHFDLTKERTGKERKRERESNNVKSFGTCKLLSKAASAKQLPRQRSSLFMKHACPAYACHFTCETRGQGSRVQQQGNVSQERAHLAQWKRTLDSWLDTRYRHTNYQRDVRFLHIHWCASSNNEILPSIRIRQRQGSTSRRSINSRPSFTGLDNVSRHSFPDMHFCGEISVRFSLRRTPR